MATTHTTFTNTVLAEVRQRLPGRVHAGLSSAEHAAMCAGVGVKLQQLQQCHTTRPRTTTQAEHDGEYAGLSSTQQALIRAGSSMQLHKMHIHTTNMGSTWTGCMLGLAVQDMLPCVLGRNCARRRNIIRCTSHTTKKRKLGQGACWAEQYTPCFHASWGGTALAVATS